MVLVLSNLPLKDEVVEHTKESPRMLYRFASMIVTLLLISGFFTVEAQDTKWNNLADKYANSYKAFLDADCPIGADEITHFVYFARDRHRIRNHAFLQNKQV